MAHFTQRNVIVLWLIGNDEFPDGTMTIEHVSALLIERFIAPLKEKYGIHVAAIASDCAASMLGVSARIGVLTVKDASHGFHHAAALASSETGDLRLKRGLRAAKEFVERNAGIGVVKHIKAVREQRWLDTHRWLVKVLDVAGQGCNDANFAPMLGGQRKLVEDAIETLDHFRAAVRVCEGDCSDQLHILEGLATIGFNASHDFGAFGALDRQGSLQVKLAVDERIITPLLVIASYFAPIKLGLAQTPHGPALAALMRKWLCTRALKELAAKLGLSPTMLPAEFDNHARTQFNERAEALSRASYASFLADRTALFPNLFGLLVHLVGLVSGEASAERAFHALRLTVGDNRASLSSESVDAAVRMVFFARHIEDVALNHPYRREFPDIDEEPEPQPVNVDEAELAGQAPHNDAANAAVAAERVAFETAVARAAHGVVMLACEKVARVNATPKPTHAPARGKCGKCSHPIGNHQAGQWLWCRECELFYSYACIDAMPTTEDAVASFTCATCDANPRVAWW
jgi:hypothetical protein